MMIEAELALGDRTIPVVITWQRINRIQWDEGHGWHASWEQTDGSIVRFLDESRAVIFSDLPGPYYGDLDVYHPNIVIVNRDDPRLISVYWAITEGASVGDSLALNRFKLRQLDEDEQPRPMSEAEKVFRDELMEHRAYGGLAVTLHSREQWSQSSELAAKLVGLEGIQLLGKFRDMEGYHQLVRLNNILRWPDNRRGMAPGPNGWTLMEHPRVFTLRDGTANDFQEGVPVMLLYRGIRFNFHEHELLFDADSQVLYSFQRQSLFLHALRYQPPPYGGYR